MKALPYQVGIDIVKVCHIQDSIERFGNRFLNRIFTKGELAYCQSLSSASAVAQSMAARFAAKEATIKVLRPEVYMLDWRNIEIHRSEGGWCDLVLSGEATDLARSRGIAAFSVSMSHEEEYATAVVIADTE
ncbi:MAG TPA: holo-ACP synthase [Ktedonobacteraceae bacterium]|nr:holo-ACP synthase [Ktedonobacteraceae bacterium]